MNCLGCLEGGGAGGGGHNKFQTSGFLIFPVVNDQSLRWTVPPSPPPPPPPARNFGKILISIEVKVGNTARVGGKERKEKAGGGGGGPTKDPPPPWIRPCQPVRFK